MAEDPVRLRENARKLRDDVMAMMESVGSYTSKSDARLTGCSLYVKFEKKVDIMDSIKVQNLMLGAPQLVISMANAILGLLEDEPEMA